MSNLIPSSNGDLITNDGLLASYEAYLQAQHKSAATVSTYVFRLGKFFGWLGDKPWNLVQPADVLAYREYLAKDYAPQSVSLHLTSGRQFYSMAVMRGFAQFNPFSEVKAPSRNGTRRRKKSTISRQEWQALLDTTNPGNDADVRDRAILVLAYELGLRGIEIIRADVGDLRTNGGRKRLWVQGKGQQDKDEFMYLPDSVEAVINDWLAVRGSEPGALFVSLSPRSKGKRLDISFIRYMWNKRKQEAGIADPDGTKTFHSLRHTAIDSRARYAVRHGKSPYLLQTFARHKDPKTTMGYIHDIGREDDPPEDWGTNTNGG